MARRRRRAHRGDLAADALGIDAACAGARGADAAGADARGAAVRGPAADPAALAAYTASALRLAAVYTFRPGPRDLPARLAAAAAEPDPNSWTSP